MTETKPQMESPKFSPYSGEAGSFGKAVTEKFQRDLLTELLAKCTDKQRDNFQRMYPNGVPTERLAWAISQCNSTVRMNGEPAPTSQPQGELREREKETTMMTENEKLYLGANSLGNFDEAMAEHDAAIEAATIERCAEAAEREVFPSGDWELDAPVMGERVRKLATAPQTSALAVKMAEARLEALREVKWEMLCLVNFNLVMKWLDAELEKQALAAAKER